MYGNTCPINPMPKVHFYNGRHVNIRWEDGKKTWGVVAREMLEENKPGWFWCRVEDDGRMHRVPIHWSQMSLT